jgi:hypothetical protein
VILAVFSANIGRTMSKSFPNPTTAGRTSSASQPANNGQPTKTSDINKPTNIGNKAEYPITDELVIELDNGPAVNSRRTQFIKRMVQFAQTSQLKVRLILLSALSQQVQPHRTLLGGVRKLLERHYPGLSGRSFEMGCQYEMERLYAYRRVGRNRLSEGR